MYQRIRRGLEVGSGSMVMALTLFLGLIGFNSRLAWRNMEALEVPPLLSPGFWSGTLAERFQALGYEVASIDLQAGTATVTFDDGRVLTVDRTTGGFSLMDARLQEIVSGAVVAALDRDGTAQMDAAFALADEPGMTHELGAYLETDVTRDGHVIVQGYQDTDSFDENVDLSSLSYRPDGSTDTPNRQLDQPRGVLAGEIFGNPGDGGARLWGVIMFLIVVVVLLLILGSCLDQTSSMKRRTIPGLAAGLGLIAVR